MIASFRNSVTSSRYEDTALTITLPSQVVNIAAASFKGTGRGKKINASGNKNIINVLILNDIYIYTA